MSYVVATIKPWNINNFHKRNFNENWHLITSPEEYNLIRDLKPRYVFFPHWSWMIPQDIYKNYECVIFHMTDLPFGRGAEPLQHLISRGLKETMVSAIQCEQSVDSGNIYMKRPMSLYGNAEEIYMRCSDIIFEMIQEIATKELKAEVEQFGKPTYFVKRVEKDCQIPDISDLQRIFDCIRMQDAETYQSSYIETEYLRFEFTRANIRSNCIEANVIIKLRGRNANIIA